jgi:hypothetical protein
VQDRAPQGRSARDLRKLEAQAETRLKELPELPVLPKIAEIDHLSIEVL